MIEYVSEEEIRRRTNKKQSKERRSRQASGLCWDCKQPAELGYIRCRFHLDKHNEYERDRRNRLRD